jgi:hypothetical protein
MPAEPFREMRGPLRLTTKDVRTLQERTFVGKEKKSLAMRAIGNQTYNRAWKSD